MNRHLLKTVAFLGGCCFFCVSLEYAIPKPLPFLRLGIANIPVMAAIHVLPFPAVCLIVLLKIVGQALISGTLFSYIALLSCAGTFVSAAVMYMLYTLLYKKKLVSWIGLSIAGATSSNVIQLLLAAALFMGSGVRYLVPVFLAAGVVSGTVLGYMCQKYFSVSCFLPQLADGAAEISQVSSSSTDIEQSAMAKAQSDNETLQRQGSGGGIVAGVVCLLLLLTLPQITMHFAPIESSLTVESCVPLFLSLCFMLVQYCRKSSVKILPWIITVVAVTFANMLVPAGRVLCSIGSFPITENALLTGLKRAGIFECMISISRLMIAPNMHIPGKIGRLLTQSFLYFGLLTRLPHSRINDIKKITTDTIDRYLENVFIAGL